MKQKVYISFHFGNISLYIDNATRTQYEEYARAENKKEWLENNIVNDLFKLNYLVKADDEMMNVLLSLDYYNWESFVMKETKIIIEIFQHKYISANCLYNYSIRLTKEKYNSNSENLSKYLMASICYLEINPRSYHEMPMIFEIMKKSNLIAEIYSALPYKTIEPYIRLDDNLNNIRQIFKKRLSHIECERFIKFLQDKKYDFDTLDERHETSRYISHLIKQE